MPTIDRASLASPLRSPAIFVSAVRSLARRYRLGRLLAGVTIVLVAALRLQGALDAAATERARWAPGAIGWVTTTDIEAGAPLDAGMAIPVEVPAGLSPRGATVDDPTGTRARVDLVAGVILHDNQLIGESSAHTARTPPGSAAIALDRTSDLFVVGDRVDLHDLVDGRRLGINGVVIAVTDGDIAVAIDAYAVPDVVRGLGRGGVVPVLRAG